MPLAAQLFAAIKKGLHYLYALAVAKLVLEKMALGMSGMPMSGTGAHSRTCL